ncbi:MAG: hypothetical protein IJI47_05385 [Eubacterium sp.]|nr:hypothetical protein [Eubacterium sp.]
MKKHIALLGIMLVLSMSVAMVAFGDDDYELPKVPLTNSSTSSEDPEHDWGEWEETTPAVPATCTENGTTAIETRVCKDDPTHIETRGGEVIPATGHDWGDWEITTPEVPAECEKPGTTAIETRVCAHDSNHIQTRGGDEIPELQHNYIGTVTVPTCTNRGYTTYTCEHCNDSYVSDYVNAKGHTFEISSIDWNTLDTATGTVTANYVCSNDNRHTKAETVQTTFEVIRTQTEEDPEITRFSYTEGTFSDTKDIQTKTPVGHITHAYTVPVSIAWDGADAITATVTLKCNKCEETTTTAASVTSEKKSNANCTDAAVYTFTASYDGLDSISKDVTIGSPLGHSLGKTNEVPAECTKTGTEAYWTCSTCHKMFSDENAQNEIDAPVVIPAKGHSWNSGVVTAPTCTARGYTTYTCTVCTQTDVRDYVNIDPEAHNWGDWEITTAEVPATCTEDGTTAIETRICANDPTHTDTRGGAVIAAKGHDWGDWEITTAEIPATCTKNGTTAVETRVCNNDATHTETRGGEVIPAGHKYDPVTHICTICKAIDRRWETDPQPLGYKLSDKKCTVSGIVNKVYTGKAITQSVTVKYDGKTLKNGTDYSVAYKNNVNAGTATVIITGKGLYSESKSVTFKITALDISKCTVSGIAATKVYTGKSITPAPTVKFGKTKLVKGTAYTVAYKNNKYVGVATVTVSGKGNFKGSVNKTFKILPKATAVNLASPKKGQLKITWTKVTAQTNGYQLQYSTSSKFTAKTTKKVTIANPKTAAKTISKLKSKKRYYVRVRTYKKVGKATYFSSWSTKSIVIK